ncbi:MAG: hypothetical protein C4326_11315 [Ignavibacteria bacterium]
MHLHETETPTASVRVVREPSAFDALEAEWHRLLELSDVSVFQSFEWQRTWWRHFGERNPSASLHILLVNDGEDLIGIAPFFIERVRTLGVLSYKRLAFIGTGPSDYVDALFARGKEVACADCVADYLAEHRDLFDVIDLQDMTDRLPNHQLLYEALSRRGLRGTHFINEYCPRTLLKETWEETLASFKIDNRREIRRRQRNLHKNFAVEYEVVTREEDAQRGIEEFIQMHQMKWRNDGHSGVFADSSIARFHRDVVQRFARRGWLFLAFMNANGERAATLYCFVFRDDLAVYLTGNANRSDVFKYSPGRVLTAFCMEEAVKLGKKVCDFMRGTEPYKYELDAKDVPNWTVLMYNPHSFKPELRHKIDLLIRSLRRRAGKEWLLLRAVVREKGILSAPTLRHIATRVRQNLVDGLMKAKAPERATNVRPKLNGQSENK